MTNPEEVEKLGFSQIVRRGNLLFCAGQIGVEADGTTPEDPRRQFGLAFQALGRVLESEGATAQQIVDLTTFHVGLYDHLELFVEEKTRFLNGARPAWTAIEVVRVGYPETLVEIKAIACLDDC
jgi:enamine deaminase RidA (YjgF/YER057c/UK114 family)